MLCIFLFKHKTAYEMRISDWSSDVCSSDLDFLRLCLVFRFDRKLRQQLIEHLLELAFGARLRQVGDRLPLKNGIDRRDRLHTKLRRAKGIFIDIDLDQLDALGRIFRIHLLDDVRKINRKSAESGKRM